MQTLFGIQYPIMKENVMNHKNCLRKQLMRELLKNLHLQNPSPVLTLWTNSIPQNYFLLFKQLIAQKAMLTSISPKKSTTTTCKYDVTMCKVVKNISMSYLNYFTSISSLPLQRNLPENLRLDLYQHCEQDILKASL